MPPEFIIDRIAGAGKGKDARAWRGARICAEMIQEIQASIEGVHGVHIMAVEWEIAVKSIVEMAGRDAAAHR